MANYTHLDILRKGIPAWNEWRKQNPDMDPDLRDADLSNRFLLGVNFERTDLREAILYNTQFVSSRVANITSLGGDPSGAMDAFVKEVEADGKSWEIVKRSNEERYHALPNVFDVRTTEHQSTSLQNARLDSADLQYAILSGVNLNGTSFQGAKFGGTLLNSYLRSTSGLEEVNHSGRSSLSLQSLTSLPHPIPISFLQGCGLSDLEIEFAKLYQDNLSISQVTDIGYRIIEIKSNPAIQFYSCFISYSSVDEHFARRIYDDLQKSGVRCWFAPNDLRIGDKFRYKIDEAIRSHDKLLLILSKAAIESGWVEYESNRAHSQEMKSGDIVLFPVRLDNAVLEVEATWADFIREERHIGDFSDPTKYNESFQRLLRDLREEN